MTLFLALLELMRLGRARAAQDGVCGEIVLVPGEGHGQKGESGP